MIYFSKIYIPNLSNLKVSSKIDYPSQKSLDIIIRNQYQYNQNSCKLVVTLLSILSNMQFKKREVINRIVDYRNAKYQGQVELSTLMPYGKGLLLDQNYLLTISQWKEGVIQGKSLMAFSDGSLFYGSVSNMRPAHLCVYRQTDKLTIYIKHESEEANLIIINHHIHKTILVLYFSPETIQQLSEKGFTFIELQRHFDIFNRKVYANEKERQTIIQQLIKQTKMIQYKDYSSFVEQNFSNDSEQPILTSRNQKVCQFSYAASSIVCKINQDPLFPHVFNVKLVGFFNENTNEMEVFKRYNECNGMIQEYINSNLSTYKVNSQRPVRCAKDMHNYYKKSLVFNNGYFKTEYIYKIKSLFTNISSFSSAYLDQASSIYISPPINTPLRQLRWPKNQSSKSNAKVLENYSISSKFESKQQTKEVETNKQQQFEYIPPIFKDLQKDQRQRREYSAKFKCCACSNNKLHKYHQLKVQIPYQENCMIQHGDLNKLAKNLHKIEEKIILQRSKSRNTRVNNGPSSSSASYRSPLKAQSTISNTSSPLNRLSKLAWR